MRAPQITGTRMTRSGLAMASPYAKHEIKGVRVIDFDQRSKSMTLTPLITHNGALCTESG